MLRALNILHYIQIQHLFLVLVSLLICITHKPQHLVFTGTSLWNCTNKVHFHRRNVKKRNLTCLHYFWFCFSFLCSAHCGDKFLELNLGSDQEVILNANFRYSQAWIVIGQTGEAIQRELESGFEKSTFCFLVSGRNGDTKHSQTTWGEMESRNKIIKKIKDHNANNGANWKAMTWFDALGTVMGHHLACAGRSRALDSSSVTVSHAQPNVRENQ